ncbi:recombinase family protein [Kribbella sp. CA-293567]|uniref:recombinase family protein n=1 Tax=Kribbella sp. CA-293567 TaxID=3002436 RepID=UPI0022DDD715|nr:recombinase family protein [Kribbella sp. CA-293567]WBQ03776.1 recombinase family protein [Kribbella sp. CA-293567]
MTVADLYLRLSESDDASTSIARQEADLRLLCEREGWTVGEVLIDDGLSGGYTRAKAVEALERLRTGQSHVLAVWKFDRWSRQGLTALAALIEALDESKTGLFVAERDGLRSSQPAWRIIASVLAEVARMERENIQTRVRSSIAALKKGGRFSGGTLAYGYESAKDPNSAGRVLVLSPSESAIVREAASRVLRGESVYRITTDFNTRGVPTRRAKHWTVTALRQILVSDAIVGRVTHDGELLRGPDGLPVEVWPPVLDLETWHRLRARLDADKPGSERTQRRRRARLLSGIVKCGGCGRPLYVKYNGQGQTSYGCSARNNGQPCPGVAIVADQLEEYVTGRFLSAVGHLEVFERVEELPDIAALADVEQAISATAAKMADDDADVVTLAAQLANLKVRRTELKSRPAERVVKLVGKGFTFAEYWEAANDVGLRNALLAANIATLSVAKGRKVGKGPIDFGARVALLFQPAHYGDAWRTPEGRVYAEAV